MKTVLLSIAMLCITTVSYGHGGRTNSSGCHNDNIHGGNHCHNGGRSYDPGFIFTRIDLNNSLSATPRSASTGDFWHAGRKLVNNKTVIFATSIQQLATKVIDRIVIKHYPAQNKTQLFMLDGNPCHATDGDATYINVNIIKNEDVVFEANLMMHGTAAGPRLNACRYEFSNDIHTDDNNYSKFIEGLTSGGEMIYVFDGEDDIHEISLHGINKALSVFESYRSKFRSYRHTSLANLLIPHS